MKFTLFTILLSMAAGSALAQVCEWYLNPDDCICMQSTDGSLLRTQTASCCKSLGYKTTNSVRFFPLGLYTSNISRCSVLDLCRIALHCRYSIMSGFSCLGEDVEGRYVGSLLRVGSWEFSLSLIWVYLGF